RFAPSINREVFKRFTATGAEAEQNTMTPEQLIELQMAIWKRKTEQDKELVADASYHYVVDRTPVDNFSYMTYRCLDTYDERLWHQLNQESKRAVSRSYQAVFYFPLYTFAKGGDGMREDHFGKRAINAMMDWAELMETHEWSGIPVYQMPIDEVGSRVDFILNRLGLKRNN